MSQWVIDRDALAARVNAKGIDAVIADALVEGVAGLVAHTAGPDLHPQLNDLRRRLMVEGDLVDAEARRVTAALGRAGVRAVMLKGAVLAHTVYPEPWCRTRGDLDLLVSRRDRAAAGTVMRSLGYGDGGLTSGDWVMQQDLWERDLVPGLPHQVDVHVELSNRVSFASRLPAEALLGRSVAAPFAGVDARQLDPVDALLFSCVHRVAHHAKHPRLVWSYDIAHQAAGLGAEAVPVLQSRAIASGVASVCAHELRAASTVWRVHTGACAAAVIETLDAAGRTEDARAFLGAGRGRLGDAWLDLKALANWRARAAFLCEHVWPPRAFMLRQPGATPRNLPWRYLRRLLQAPFRIAR